MFCHANSSRPSATECAWKRLVAIVLQANLPVTTYCWTENKPAEISSGLRQPEQIQKDYSQSKPIIKSADPKDSVIKTSAKSQDESQDTCKNHMMPDRDQVKPWAPMSTWRFWKYLNYRSPDDPISNSQWEYLKKRGFPGHMTIYRYKYRLICTEIQFLRDTSLSAFRPEAEVKLLSQVWESGYNQE